MERLTERDGGTTVADRVDDRDVGALGGQAVRTEP